MARLRYNGMATGSAGALADITLSGAHNSSTTTLTFNDDLTYANGTAVPTISGSDYFMLSILDSGGRVAEIVKVTAYTSGASTATVTRGQEDTSGVAHSSGAKVVHAGTANDVGAKRFDSKSRTSGSVSMTSTSITAVDTGLDLALAAAPGDLIEFGLNVRINASAFTTCFDVYTMVGGSRVNPFGAGLSASLASTIGVPGWVCQDIAQEFLLNGTVVRTLASGDISSGTVTLRLHYAKSNTSSRGFVADSNSPAYVWAINHGPVA